MSKLRARQLRSKFTDAERILWKRLRGYEKEGLHFRRQAPFDKYIVDFVCHRAKLIVEVDGGQYAHPKTIVYDAKRTAYLESRGYRVFRVWNNDVVNNPDGVAEVIASLAQSPHPIRLRYAPAARPPRAGEVKKRI